ncbi:serrate RNA effector molecule-like isoform X2 [Lotus japonicus]|uniref:serrate RNA effector molecule-like isoform X2 n=1 Tax=Lotus japonicus TaxID=34305 RepID=UPI00258D69A8|nr:serrate RNA effector molecule-like isoform X2 [Lotus japonicus]
MAEVINAPPDSLDKSPPPSPSSASAPPPPPPPPPSLPPPSDSDLPPPPARRRDRRDDRDFDRPPNRRDYYDRSNNSPPAQRPGQGLQVPPSQRDRDRRHSPPPPYKRSRRGSPRGGYRYGPDDSGFGYDNSGGYERGVGGRVGYVDDKSSGRFGHRSAGGHQNGISDVESNRGYADLPSGSAQREGLMSYKQFIQQLEDDILPAEAERRYQEYKTEYISTQKRTYFNSHKDEEWLKDKYHPTNLLTVIERCRRLT